MARLPPPREQLDGRREQRWRSDTGFACAPRVRAEKRAHHIGERLHDVRPVAAEVGERFTPRLIGRRHFVFAPSVQDQPARVNDACRRLPQQRRLADAGFAGHERDAMVACLRRVLEEVEQRWHCGSRPTKGTPGTRARRDGTGRTRAASASDSHCTALASSGAVETLQFERAD